MTQITSAFITPEEANSFKRLTSPEMRGVTLYLQRVAAQSLDGMARADSSEIWRRLQGRYALARELLDHIDGTELARIETTRSAVYRSGDVNG